MILGSTVYQGAIHQCNTGYNGRRMEEGGRVELYAGYSYKER